MVQARSSIGRGALRDVEEQFRSWRKNRKHGGKIPLELWQAAVDLAKQYSLDEISTALSLDYGRLEKRVEAASHSQSRSSGESAGRSRFMDAGTLRASSPGECAVEVEDGAGKKFRMHLRGDGCTQALEIARYVTNALWGADR